MDFEDSAPHVRHPVSSLRLLLFCFEFFQSFRPIGLEELKFCTSGKALCCSFAVNISLMTSFL
jgi:hypothetical protein